MAFHRRTTRYPLAREKTPTANLYRQRCASTELIEHVRAGTRNPDSIEADRDQHNAIAALLRIGALVRIGRDRSAAAQNLLQCVRQPWMLRAGYAHSRFTAAVQRLRLIGVTTASGASTFGFVVLFASNWAAFRNMTLQRLQA